MNCERCRELLWKYVDGQLDGETAREVESHLAECRTCAREREAMDGVAEALRQAHEVEPSADSLARSVDAVMLALKRQALLVSLRRWVQRVSGVCVSLAGGVARRPVASVLGAIVLIALVGASFHLGMAVSSAQASRPPTPFDEPKPKIPKQILADARLDQGVKVFVKSENLKELFAKLSRRTGVKITAERDLWGERPIIYFHNRSLREVMTEISGLYGYHWLVKGKKGEYRYELFEDLRHGQRREQARSARKDALDALLVDFLKKAVESSEDEAFLESLERIHPECRKMLANAGSKSLAELLAGFGDPFLRRLLVDGQASFSFAELPPEWQAMVRDWRNGYNQRLYERSGRKFGEERGEPFRYTLEDLASATLHLSCRTIGLFGVPRLELNMETTHQVVVGVQWPPFPPTEESLRGVVDPSSIPERVVGDRALTDELKITVKKLRRLGRRSGLLLGDILEAVAKQAGVDIIADYYFQEQEHRVDYFQEHRLGPIDQEPLRKLGPRLCRTLNYTCQVDGSTLRFRFNDWFVQPLRQEPPPELLVRLWQTIEETGALEWEDILDIACLPDRQMQWAGFRFIPGAHTARRSPATFRLWRSLTPAQEAAARSESGLPVAQLTSDQQDKLYFWLKAMRADVPLTDVARSFITCTISERRWVTVEPEMRKVLLGERYALGLTLPGGETESASGTLNVSLSEEDRKELAAQRRADLEADVIEVLE